VQWGDVSPNVATVSSLVLCNRLVIKLNEITCALLQSYSTVSFEFELLAGFACKQYFKMAVATTGSAAFGRHRVMGNHASHRIVCSSSAPGPSMVQFDASGFVFSSSHHILRQTILNQQSLPHRSFYTWSIIYR
jgi:hypothetical protein